MKRYSSQITIAALALTGAGLLVLFRQTASMPDSGEVPGSHKVDGDGNQASKGGGHNPDDPVFPLPKLSADTIVKATELLEKSDVWTTRVQGLVGLSQLLGERPVLELITLLNDDNLSAQAKAEAVFLLEHLNQPVTISDIAESSGFMSGPLKEPIRSALLRVALDTKQPAIARIPSFGALSFTGHDEEVRQALFGALQNEEDPLVLRSIIYALNTINFDQSAPKFKDDTFRAQVLHKITDLVASGNPKIVRLAAIKHTALAGNPGSVPSLVNLFSDPDPEIRAESANAASTSTDASMAFTVATQAIGPFLQESDGSVHKKLRGALRVALSMDVTMGVMNELARAMYRTSDDELQIEIMEIMGGTHEHRHNVKPYLKAFVNDSSLSRRVRNEAKAILENLPEE